MFSGLKMLSALCRVWSDKSQGACQFQLVLLPLEAPHVVWSEGAIFAVQNVLLDRRGPDALVKLCDFGFSVRNEACTKSAVRCCRAVGTPDYMVRYAFDGMM